MSQTQRLFSPICLALLLGGVGVAGAQSICAAPATGGNVTGASGILNTYYPAPAGTTSLAAGSTQIPVGSGVRGASKAVAAGDLLLIIQMQGAAINTSNSSAYGQVTSGNAGGYEFAVATGAASGGSVPVRGKGTGGGLLSSYSASDATATQGQSRYQVIRVPQYGNLSLSGSAAVTAPPWDGQSGGVVVLDVTGQLNWNGGSVDLAARGFRGGGGQQFGGAGAGTTYLSSDYRTPSSAATNGNKGEGFAGTPRYVYDPLVSSAALTVGSNEGYPDGSRARGAPANAGGGGTDGRPSSNDENSGGGGGGNGGAGGQGGNSWNSNLAVGGVGGAATPASLARLFLGGGGGSASRNNSSGLASSGGSGGGLLIVRAGSSAGTGNVNLNGGVGLTPDNDGGGGGGAGGTAVLLVGSGTLSGLTVTANGAGGTNADPAGVRHGPGGGGGGGVIYTNASGASTSAARGTNGTTTTAADAFGAAPGTVGTIPGGTLTGVTGLREGAACPVLNVVKTTSTPAPWRGAKATYSILVSNSGGPSTTVRVQDTLPTGLTRSLSDAPTVTPASSRVNANDANTATALDLKTFKLAYGESLTVTFDVQTPTDAAYRGTTFQNSAAATTQDAAGNTVGFTYNAASSTGEDVRPLYPSLKLTKSVRNVTADDRAGGAANFSTTAGGLPTETLEYCVVYLNDGDGPLSGIAINDTIPGNAGPVPSAYGSGPARGVRHTTGGVTMDYTSADDIGITPTDIGALSQAGGMKLVLGTLAKDATGTVCFRVQIN